MPNFIALFQNKQLTALRNKVFASQLISLNADTEKHGITLSKADCADIAEFRTDALAECERIEVGLGATERIIKEFCDSGYVNQANFRQTVEDLLECFYTIKNETDDLVSDDTVMEFLHFLFETVLGGDTSKIYEATELDEFIATVKRDIPIFSNGDESESNE